MVPSSDMFHGCSASLGLDWYYQATEPAVEHFDFMFQASFPVQYPKYRAAFDAGQFARNNPGPWLGRAIVHKLQVLIRRDGEDPSDSPAAITNRGHYQGGELYLTDL